MAKNRDFSYLGAATVTMMLANAQAALAAACNAQNYSVGNRHQQNADIDRSAQLVEDLSIAQAQINGTNSPIAVANFRTGRQAGYY